MSELISPGIMHGICQVPVNGKILRNCDANRNLLAGWVHEDQGEVVSVVWFQKVLGENLRYEAQLIWDSADLLDAAKRRHQVDQALEESRKVFSNAARHLKRFGDSEANFRFACSVLGNSFNAYQLQQALDSGRLSGLAPVSSGELEAWKAEEIAAENALLKADAVTPYQQNQIREIAQRRFLDSRRTAAQVQLEYEIVTGYERDVVYGGKPVLPSEWNGQPLTPQFIHKCGRDVMKALVKRFGSSQVTARIHGIKQASAVIDRGNGRGPQVVEYSFT